MAEVVHFIKTNGVCYDDRLCKSVDAISGLGIESEVVCVQNDNRSESGQLSGSEKWRSISMLTRRLIPSPRGLVFEIIEMNLRFMLSVMIRRPRVVWVHDCQLVGMTLLLLLVWRPFGRRRRVVWDLHELPLRYFRSKISKAAVKWALERCDYLIIPNRQRKEWLEEQLSLWSRDSWIILDNLPAQEFVNRAKGELPESINEWLGDSEFVLSQGFGVHIRCTVEIGKAISMFPELKLVFLGPVEESCIDELKSFWGKEFEERIFVTGMVPQEELYHFIDYAKVSAVFYRDTSPNQWYCAPNRLFQAVARGVPVIVGANPTMRDIVDQVESGVVLKGDGSSVEDIVSGVREFLENERGFKQAAEKSRDSFVWERQAGELKRVFEV